MPGHYAEQDICGLYERGIDVPLGRGTPRPLSQCGMCITAGRVCPATTLNRISVGCTNAASMYRWGV
ncbi:hypothetical protein ACIGCO_16530, partial [Serratia sp. NPDC078756]|uniref:hypothetical protein n=1 Tax=Serratia sp. NPDC078756 TaxID=3364515 RepID=UPI0037D759F7